MTELSSSVYVRWDSSGPVNNLVTLALPHLRLWTGGNYRRLTIVQSSMHEMGLSALRKRGCSRGVVGWRVTGASLRG